MAIFNSSLLFLLLITALLAFIIGWLSRKLTDGDGESVLKQKIAVLRNTISEQKNELDALNVNQLNAPTYSDPVDSFEKNDSEELSALRLENQKISDSEKDLKVKLSQLYAKKQAEINRLSSQIESLKGRLDTIKDESTLEIEDSEVELPLQYSDSHLELESQKQTIGRLENQLKIEADIYKKRIEELETSLQSSDTVDADESDKLKKLSERLASKDAELIAMQDEIKATKKQLSASIDSEKKTPVKKTVKKKKAKVTATPRSAAKKVTKKKTVKKTTTKKATKKAAVKKVAKKASKKVQTKKKVIKKAAKDDLTTINGIGPKLKTLLYKNDITTFAQIAAFKAADIKSLAEKLGNFSDRIKRDQWVKQAKKLIK